MTTVRAQRQISYSTEHPEDRTGAKIYGDFSIRNVVNGNGNVSHGDDTNPEGAIKNGYKDKENRYKRAVRDRGVKVDALVMNSGGRMCANLDKLLKSLATREMNKDLGPAADGDDKEEKSERSQHIARAKRAMQAAIQVARIRCQVSMIWAACPSTNDRRVRSRRNRNREVTAGGRENLTGSVSPPADLVVA